MNCVSLLKFLQLPADARTYGMPGSTHDKTQQICGPITLHEHYDVCFSYATYCQSTAGHVVHGIHGPNGSFSDRYRPHISGGSHSCSHAARTWCCADLTVQALQARLARCKAGLLMSQQACIAFCKGQVTQLHAQRGLCILRRLQGSSLLRCFYLPCLHLLTPDRRLTKVRPITMPVDFPSCLRQPDRSHFECARRPDKSHVQRRIPQQMSCMRGWAAA